MIFHVITYAFASFLYLFFCETPTSAQQQPVDFASELLSSPRGCFVLARNNASFVHAIDIPAYLRRVSQNVENITKYDIFCVADELSIDTPVYTNGGNVYILARTLNIRAKIDTRVYRNYDFESHFIDPPGIGGAYADHYNKEGKYFSILTVLSPEHGPVTARIRKFFEKYYECVGCRIGASKREYIPRLPDGASPPMHQMGPYTYDGEPPPADWIDFDTFRSGSVNIFADEITIRDAQESGALLNVSGLAGGLGGAGAPANCIGAWESDPYLRNRLSCLTDRVSGLSAPGTRGGDAGNIYVTTTAVGKTAQAGLRDHAQLQGGQAASDQQYRSPFADWSPSPIGFRAEGKFKQLPNGAPGELIFAEVDREEIFPSFIRLVITREAFVDYDFQEITRRAKADRSISWLTIQQYIAASIDSDIRRIYLNYADQIRFAKNLSTISNAPKKSIFCTQKNQGINLSDDLKLFLAILTPTCGSGIKQSSLSEFFLSSGGLLGVHDWNVLAKLSALQLKTVFRENEETWSRIAESLKKIEGNLLLIYKSVEQGRLESIYNHLKDDLHKVEEKRKEIEQKDQNSSVLKLLSAASGIASPAGKLYSLLQLFVDGKSLDKEGNRKEASTQEKWDQITQAGKYADEIYNAYAKTSQLLSVSDAGGSLDSLEKELRSKIYETRHQIEELATTISVQREANRRDIDSTLSENLLARSRYGKTERSSIGLFADIIRLVMLSTMFDPERQIATEERNVASLKLLINDFPTGSYQFQITTLNPDCTVTRYIEEGRFIRGNEQCISFDALNSELIVFAEYDEGHANPLIIPVYRAKAGTGRHQVPLLSFTRYILAKTSVSPFPVPPG